MYRLSKFGSNTLPGYDYDWTAGTAETVQAIVAGVGGAAFDAYGFGDAPSVLPFTVNYKCAVVSATAAIMRTTFDLWRSLRGQQLKLYRTAEDDATEQWAWARLMQVQASNSPSNQKMLWQPLELVFQVMSTWNGADHSEDFALTAGDTTACAMDNDGNVPVADCVLTVTAGDAAITALTVTIGAMCSFTYDGTIAISKSLVIDCGAFSILNDGADAYVDFELGAGHTVLEWLRLEPGETTVAVAITGGGTGAEAVFVYYDAWA
jgi:hypothetical protein